PIPVHPVAFLEDIALFHYPLFLSENRNRNRTGPIRNPRSSSSSSPPNPHPPPPLQLRLASNNNPTPDPSSLRVDLRLRLSSDSVASQAPSPLPERPASSSCSSGTAPCCGYLCSVLMAPHWQELHVHVQISVPYQKMRDYGRTCANLCGLLQAEEMSVA
ncbi:hypothetical protein Taro_006175, partial [Colocasia esculenta]|nr:hypothetical protein [Colocasia esculenta]